MVNRSKSPSNLLKSILDSIVKPFSDKMKRLLDSDNCTSEPLHKHPTPIRNDRIKKRPYAILLMYSGWGYYGMHRNPGFPTIEQKLSEALIACEYLNGVSTDHYRQLPQSPDISAKLNNLLPETIRIIDTIRVTRGYDAKKSCSHRVYDYLIPSFALAPIPKDSNPLDFRISAEGVCKANNVLEHYKGTRNYFNFTSGRLAGDKSCYRYMMALECLPSFLVGDHEYCIIRITGQSFMLHQIRKMIGLAIGVLRGHTDETVFDIVFGNGRVDVPKAPGLGLMLNHVNYAQYNEKYGSDGFHSTIDWTRYEDQIAAFKYKNVYLHIDKVETEEKSMLEWLNGLPIHTFTYRDSKSPNPINDPVAPPSTSSEQNLTDLEKVRRCEPSEALRIV